MTRLSPVLLLSCCILIAGCATSTSTTPQPTVAGINGDVHGGQQPVSGATIQLYAAGTSSDGSAATPLIASTVATDANGGFNITGLYQCPSASSLVYLAATGGNPGLSVGANPQLGLMTALGPCGNLSASTFISVNELTTVAAVYSLAPYATSFSAVGSSSSDLTALAAAFTLATQLVNTTTGKTPGLSVPSGFTVPVAQIDTVANILAPCINSTGGTSGDTSNCGQFFSLTLPAGTAPPTNALDALLNLAQHPALNTPSLFDMATPTAPYQPSDTTQPPDLSVSLMPVASLYLSLTSWDFGVNAEGVAGTDQTVTVTNISATPAIFSSVSYTGANPQDFIIRSNTCTGSLAFNASCSIDFRSRPVETGNLSANLSIFSNASGSPANIAVTATGVADMTANPAAVSFPSTPAYPPSGTANQQTIQLSTDISGGTITGLTFSGPNASAFSQTNTCQTTNFQLIDAICSITITFDPLATGSYSASLNIASNSYLPIPAIPITGTAVTSTATVVSFPTQVFPATVVGQTAATNVNFSLTSSAMQALITGISITGANPGDFAFNGYCVNRLVNGSNDCGIYVTFTPAATGTRSANLVVTSTAANSPTSIALSGMGLP